MKFELSIIVPTLNESGNILPLFQEISRALQHASFEIIFVDDNSEDGTVEQIDSLIEQHPHVRLMRRINNRGLSSACIDGFNLSNAKYLAVIDADLQHDPALLALMLETVQSKNMDAVIASRFHSQSKIMGLSSAREKLSKIGNTMSRFITGAQLSDPLSGYFLIKKEVMNRIVDQLSGKGFKILLDIFSTCKLHKIKLTYVELPTIFRPRNEGNSKLDSLVIIEFLILLLDKIIGKHLPVRFALFILVGLSGLVVHTLLLTVMMMAIKSDFYLAQSVATMVAMTHNFVINNIFTYRDRRLRGFNLIKGFISFCIACSFGAVINVIIASFLYEKGLIWLASGFIGCIVGSIWNYSMTANFTWKKTISESS